MTLATIATPLASTASFPNGVRVVRLVAGSELTRIHQANIGPLWFGPAPSKPAAYRFDATAGQYRTCYLAERLDGAFVETILHGRAGTRILPRAFVDMRAWTVFHTLRDMTLVKLHDDGLLWHGTDASISSSDDYSEPRRVAMALHAQAPGVDGIAYRARHNNGEICFALFDRVTAADMSTVSTTPFALAPSKTDELARNYGLAFDTSAPVPPP